MDWQERYVNGDTPWDKNAPAPAINQISLQKPALLSPGRKVLVPGCGYGYDALALAELGLDVTGLDIAELALQKASTLTPDNLSVEWLADDAFQLPASRHHRYDMVWEHTFLCAIAPEMREEYVKAMWRYLKPNGCLLGVFFTNPDMAPGEGPPYKIPRSEIIELMGSLFALEWETEPTEHYPGREGREHIMLFRRLSSCCE